MRVEATSSKTKQLEGTIVTNTTALSLAKET